MPELSSHFAIHFTPLVPAHMLALIAALGLVLAIASSFRFRHGLFWRIAALALIILTLSGPSILKEERKPVDDVAAIIVDRSLSQQMGNRTAQTDEALAGLKATLENVPGLELRITEAPLDNDSPGESTELFRALENRLADIPESRRAGAILITDGRVHDTPGSAAASYGPLHALLTGAKNERDRRLAVIEAPAYGIVGKTVEIRYSIIDENTGKNAAGLRISGNGETLLQSQVTPGKEQTAKLEITRPGQNVFELEAEAVPGEASEINNRATLVVNGIRDRLKVLLVSGLPYNGERTWRNILKSDPGVDLVHFTILREPEKLDATPYDELALIVFPINELFEVKLKEFDLIIFDRYRQNSVMPLQYFANIANYVKNGGALFVASGPEFIGMESIARSPLSEILPASPGSGFVEKPFMPKLSDTGRFHPVTRPLAEIRHWGRWLRQIDLVMKSGKVLMEGANGSPLLVLEEVGSGRVAQLASDQIWLWAKGYEGGGPYSDLLRRTVHWLMKEPELEENSLIISPGQREIALRMRTSPGTKKTITVTPPTGAPAEVVLKETDNGWMQANMEAKVPGVYSFEHNGNRQFASMGSLNPPEFRGITATQEILSPPVKAAKGGIFWISEGIPDTRLVKSGGSYAGNSWLGLRRNSDYSIAGVASTPLIPSWLGVLLVLFTILAGWWRESGR